MVIGRDVVSKKYLVDSVFTGIWNSMGRDADGTIYIACGHNDWDYISPQKDIAFFKFDDKKDLFIKIGTVKEASKKNRNWVSSEAFPTKPFDAAGKVHTSIRYYGGKMFFATATTMDVYPYIRELEFYPKFFRGSHLYCYDVTSGTLSDLNKKNSVFAPGDGIQDIAIDHHHNVIFGIGYPTGKIYKFDMTTGESKAVWQSPDGLPNHNGGAVSRNLMIDNNGILWFANGSKLIGYTENFDEIHDSIDELKIRFPNNEGTYTGHFQAMAYSASRDTIYFQRQGVNKIYRFRVKDRVIDFIADAKARSLLLRWDLGKLYWIAEDDTNKFNLYEHDILSAKTERLIVGGDGITKLWSGNGDSIDKFGNLWFTDKTVKEGSVLKVSLGVPCSSCDKNPFSYGQKPLKFKHEWPKRDVGPID